jgi:protein SCO1/2
MTRVLPFLALFVAGCGAAARTPTGSGDSMPDLDFPVGHFSLTERSGRTLTDQDLRGKVWIASFVFTRCMGPCPTVTSTVARLQRDLADEPDVRFVTFTVDPTRDHLEDLREYARLRNADPDRWLFLTGDETAIHKMIKEQFKQAVERKSGEDAKPGDEFGHSTRLVLVDKQGVIRAFASGMANADQPDGPAAFEAGLARLEKRARELAKE